MVSLGLHGWRVSARLVAIWKSIDGQYLDFTEHVSLQKKPHYPSWYFFSGNHSKEARDITNRHRH